MKHRCISCRKLFEEKDIEYSPDPYAEEIDGNDDDVWECFDCRRESVRDI